MIVKAFTKNDTDIYKKTVLKYGNREQEIYYWFLQDIDTTQFRWGRHKTLDVVKWFLKGFNDDFLTKYNFHKTTQNHCAATPQTLHHKTSKTSQL